MRGESMQIFRFKNKYFGRDGWRLLFLGDKE